MKKLEEKILAEGEVLPGEVLRVGSFLNQQIDTSFSMELGKEIARLFAGEGITKIVTIEASGIAIAFAAGVALGVPIVFAKKSKSSNVAGKTYSSVIHSYTHGNTYTATLSSEYISPDDTVLIVDDFLATGEALRGLIDIVDQSGAKLVGAASAIEKCQQGGGDDLRSRGIHLESLAMIESMTDDGLIKFRR